MGLLPYLIAGIILVASAAGFYGKIHHDGYVEGKAELQPKLTACEGVRDALGTQVKEQNAAVESLKAAGDAKAKESAKALAKAEGKAKVWQDQSARLTAVLANRQPSGPKDCKAAWEEIRK